MLGQREEQDRDERPLGFRKHLASLNPSGAGMGSQVIALSPRGLDVFWDGIDEAVCPSRDTLGVLSSSEGIILHGSKDGNKPKQVAQLEDHDPFTGKSFDDDI